MHFCTYALKPLTLRKFPLLKRVNNKLLEGESVQNNLTVYHSMKALTLHV